MFPTLGAQWISSLIFACGCIIALRLHSKEKTYKQARNIVVYFIIALFGMYLGLTLFALEELMSAEVLRYIQNNFTWLTIAPSLIATGCVIALMPKKIFPWFNEVSLAAYSLVLLLIHLVSAGPMHAWTTIHWIYGACLIICIALIFRHHTYTYRGRMKILLFIINASMGVYLIIFLNDNIFSLRNYTTNNLSFIDMGSVLISSIVFAGLIIKGFFICAFLLVFLYPCAWCMGYIDYHQKKYIERKKITRKQAMKGARDTKKQILLFFNAMKANFGAYQISFLEAAFLVGLASIIYISISQGWIQLHVGVVIYLVLLDVVGRVMCMYVKR